MRLEKGHNRLQNEPTNLAECFGFSVLNDASKIPVAFVVEITPSWKALAYKVPYRP